MPLDVSVASMTFSDGTSLPVEATGVTLIVGANNSGKSRTLQDIRQCLAGGPGQVLTGVTRRGSISVDAVVAWTEELGGLVIRQEDGSVSALSVPHFGGIPIHEVHQAATSPHIPGQLLNVIVQSLDASQRLSLVNVTPSFDDVAHGFPTTPLQVLQVNPDLEAQLSEACQAAFGVPITLSRLTGPNLRLYVGRPQRTLDLLDREYAAELTALPLVEQQGDGYKAFVGILLAVSTARAPILVIDEPEAFLHPPQARRLGQQLAKRSADGSQVLCATHSSDVLEGALTSGTDVSVIRLVRDGNINRPTGLAAAELRDLWADPLIRYCGALDSLFSRGLVICENDRDCTFYLAVSDEDPGGPSDHDLKFVSVGGKSSIPRVAAAIGALGVPVQAICDLDVLNDEDLLSRIVSSLGGLLTPEMSRDLRIVTGAVTSLSGSAELNEVRLRLSEALDLNEGRTVTEKTRKALQAVLRKPTGWKRMKQDGLAPLRGEQLAAAKRLLEELAKIGLHVVACGELEGWVPEAGAKGPDWLRRAFELRGHESNSVRLFMRRVTTRG